MTFVYELNLILISTVLSDLVLQHCVSIKRANFD